MARAFVFLSFLALHKYIAEHKAELAENADGYTTASYRQEFGSTFWVIHGLIGGYVNYIWTEHGWGDIDYYTEMYEIAHWEAGRDGPERIVRDEMKIVRWVIIDEQA
jgi:hypothetical protein